MVITRLTALHKSFRRAILGSPRFFKRQALDDIYDRVCLLKNYDQLIYTSLFSQELTTVIQGIS